MCSPSPAPVQQAPAVAPPPTRQQVAAEEAADTAKKTVETTRENAVKVDKRQGIYNNIVTSPQGDPTYGFATIGGSRKNRRDTLGSAS